MTSAMLCCCSSFLTRPAAKVNSLRRVAPRTTLRVSESFCLLQVNLLSFCTKRYIYSDISTISARREQSFQIMHFQSPAHTRLSPSPRMEDILIQHPHSKYIIAIQYCSEGNCNESCTTSLLLPPHSGVGSQLMCDYFMIKPQ